MADFSLFAPFSRRTQAAGTRNETGGVAYTLSAKQQLAQLAATGCLNATFYADAESQLAQVLDLTQNLSAEFIAQTAVYARRQGMMKDMPALLLAVLAQKDVSLCARVFDRVADNGKMLRNFAQIIRSGAVGRRSFGSRPKKLIQNWLLTATEKQLLNAAVGTRPSLADLVKMVHPKPQQPWRAAWFAWLIGQPYNEADLPPLTREFEDYKRRRSGIPPAVPFQMLTSLDLDTAAWTHIMQQSSWQQLRQNLNTFRRHGVFADPAAVRAAAVKLRDPAAIARARVLPYQLLTAFQAAGGELPAAIANALQDAMETAVRNVPAVSGRVVVCPDVSGSMHSPVTGYRGSAGSKTRCIDAAALMAAALLRQNPEARVLPFETQVVPLRLNPRDSIMTNADKLARIGGGGTACASPIARLNRERAQVDLVVMVSDNESWADLARGSRTGLAAEWDTLKQRCPQAKLVCLDIQPYTSAQVPNRRDILNIGGFSDQVFALIGRFARHGAGADFWVDEIEKTELDAVH